MRLMTIGDLNAGNNALGTFNISSGAGMVDAYFMKMVCTAVGRVVINCSDRFTLESMNGRFWRV